MGEVLTAVDPAAGEDMGCGVQLEKQPDGTWLVVRVLFSAPPRPPAGG